MEEDKSVSDSCSASEKSTFEEISVRSKRDALELNTSEDINKDVRKFYKIAISFKNMISFAIFGSQMEPLSFLQMQMDAGSRSSG